eukprot:6488926-Pyramimonas_sp.AAC.1
MDPQAREEVEQRGLEHVDLCVRVARYQRRKGRYFSFEHPEGASSWDLGQIRELLAYDDVHSVVTDQCEFGLS